MWQGIVFHIKAKGQRWETVFKKQEEADVMETKLARREAGNKVIRNSAIPKTGFIPRETRQYLKV